MENQQNILPSEILGKIAEFDEHIGIIQRQIRWNKAYLTGIILLSLGLGLFTGWLIWA